MTTPTFEYRGDGYLPERLEHYLRRFEELLSSSQSAAVNAAVADGPSRGTETGGSVSGAPVVTVFREHMENAGIFSPHAGFEQDIRREIYSRFATGEENPVQAAGYTGFREPPASRPESEMNDAWRELRLKLEDLIRAVEQNTERLGEQNRDTLELSD